MRLNQNTYTAETAIKDMESQGYPKETAENHPVLDAHFNDRGRRIIEGVKPPKRPETAINMGRASLEVMERAANYAATPPDRSLVVEDRGQKSASDKPLFTAQGDMILPSETEEFQEEVASK